MSVYAYEDFREVLHWKIAENRAVRGYRARMAEAAGFQRSFLSHVVNGSVLLTPDHALALARFWNFDDDETSYFLGLVNLSRAQTPTLRRYHRAQLQEIKSRHEDLSRLLDRREEKLLGTQEAKYYSAWYWSAVHIAASLPGINTVEKIADRLHLDPRLVESTLQGLLAMGLVERAGEGWRITQRHLHVPKGSPHALTHHANWRHKVISRLQEGQTGGLHYSVVYGVSRSSAARLRQQVLELIEKSKDLVESSPEEDLVVFACDLFGL